MTTGLDDLKAYIGNSATAADVVTASQVGRLDGALGVDHPATGKGDALPPGWHAVFFPALAPLASLREDGQPSGGGIAPPVPLPRRRLVGVRGAFHEPLRVGDDITRLTEVAEVAIEDHGAGPTVLVTVRESITSPRGLAVVDERDVLYFGDDGPGDVAGPPQLPATAAWRRTYESDPVMIFRMSAVRYNSHRIHYDRDYTTRVEGYPGLVVPVTLISFLMMEMCRAEAADRPLTSFAYRSVKPVIDLGPYTLFGAPDGDAVTLWAHDHEDTLVVTAEARLSG